MKVFTFKFIQIGAIAYIKILILKIEQKDNYYKIVNTILFQWKKNWIFLII